jgi:LuxR family transcriptional regulator
MDRTAHASGSFDFRPYAPAGFYLAVRVGFAFPEYEQNELPRSWVHCYTRDALMLYDPVTRWMYENTGHVRWSDIEIPDPRGVLAQAAQHGLRHGAAICVLDPDRPGLRTFGSFARSDREFETAEMRALEEQLVLLHGQSEVPTTLTDAEIEILRMVRDGLLMKEIAYELGITESAVKQRLRNAKSKLDARTATHAVALADRYGLLRQA